MIDATTQVMAIISKGIEARAVTHTLDSLVSYLALSPDTPTAWLDGKSRSDIKRAVATLLHKRASRISMATRCECARIVTEAKPSREGDVSVKKEYLGDAVYVEYDGDGLRLTTEYDGDSPTNSIYLGPSVLMALSKYARCIAQQGKDES